MSKEIITIKMEIELDSPEADAWPSHGEYISTEVEIILDKISDIRNDKGEKYHAGDGKLNSGSTYTLTRKNKK